MNAQAPSDTIDKMFWRENEGTSAGKAIGHAWVEFTRAPAGLVIEVNRKPALRVSIKYRDSGPYLAVEVAPGTNETMGYCTRTAAMVRQYVEICEAHNKLGELLHNPRAMMISETEAENSRMRSALEKIANQADNNWMKDVASVALGTAEI